MAGIAEQIQKAKTFLREVNQEMHRVTWPTSREVTGATVVVLFTSALVAVLLSVYDWLIGKALGVIIR